MTFNRVDEVVEGIIYVRYVLVDQPNFDLTFSASKLGVEISGSCRPYMDYTPVQQILSWCQYQSQRLRETGAPILQAYLDRGEI